MAENKNSKSSFWEGKKLQESIMSGILYIVALLGAVVFMIPLVWMVTSSLKPAIEIMKLPPKWIPIYDVRYEPARVVSKGAGVVAKIEKNSEQTLIYIEKPLERHEFSAGAEIKVKKGKKIAMGDLLAITADGEKTADSDGKVVKIEKTATGKVVLIKQSGEYVYDKVAMARGMVIKVAQGETIFPDKIIADMPKTGKLKFIENKDKTKTVMVLDEEGYMFFKRDLPRGSVANFKDETVVKSGDKIATMLPQFFNYVDAWQTAGTKGENFTKYTLNTLLITILNILGTIISSTLVAYGFARFKFPARDGLFMIMISTMMIPAQVTMIPTFIVFQKLGWIDSFLPLIVPSFFATSAFNIFLIRQFFMTIPYELDEAAKIDGCTYFQTFTMILMPLIKPALATVAIFSFVYSWNDFLTPLIYLNDSTKYTLALGLQTFTTMYGSYFNLMMAASTILLLPILLVFFFGQRFFIEGVATSGLKG